MPNTIWQRKIATRNTIMLCASMLKHVATAATHHTTAQANWERVFGLVVCEAAPGARILGENDDPAGLAPNHVQPVRTLGERLAIDGNRVADLEDGVLVGPCPPHLSRPPNAATDLASPEQLPALAACA